MGEMGPQPDFPLLRHRRGQRHLAETLRPLLALLIVLLVLCATVEAKVASQGGGERKCECTVIVITMRRQLTSVASRTRISCILVSHVDMISNPRKSLQAKYSGLVIRSS